MSNQKPTYEEHPNSSLWNPEASTTLKPKTVSAEDEPTSKTVSEKTKSDITGAASSKLPPVRLTVSASPGGFMYRELPFESETLA
jgi:hypothetical protein